jgi:hypothetical protein
MSLADIQSLKALKMVKQISTNNDISLVSGGTDLKDMHFKLQSIKTDRNMFLQQFQTNFEDADAYFEMFTKAVGDDTQSSHSVTNGKFVIKNTADNGNGVKRIIQTPFKANLTGSQFEIEVTHVDTNNPVYIGVYKNPTNYSMIKYNGTTTIYKEYYNDSSVLSYVLPNGSNTKGIALTAPFTLICTVFKGAWTVCAKQGNKITTVWEGNIYDGTDATRKLDVTLNPQDWYFGFGARFENIHTANATVEFDNLKVGYGSGMSMGADYKPIRYEDGDVIRNGDYIYVCATSHSTAELNGLGGINIYKLNLKNYDVQFVSKILTKQAVTNLITGDAAATILYNRNTKEWLLGTSNFATEAFTVWVGKTKQNLLSGLNIVNLQKSTLPSGATGWDFDFIYDSSLGLFKGVYNYQPGQSYKKIITASDILGTWTEVGNNTTFTDSDEGNTICRVNGKYVIAACSKAQNGLQLYDYNTLANIGLLSFDKWAKDINGPYSYATQSWGSIIPYTEGDKTYYYGVIFSMARWESKQYAYGDMWIYKADEVNNGTEFHGTYNQIR